MAARRRAAARSAAARAGRPSDPEALDAHPLVREWFGDRLKQTNEAAWKAAHSRLYDHLRERRTKANADARRPRAALSRHRPRLPRRAIPGGAGRSLYRPDLPPAGRTAHSNSMRSRIGRRRQRSCSDLLVLRRALRNPAAALTRADRALVLGEASYGLRAQGRFEEALPAMRDGLRMDGRGEGLDKRGDRRVNLSETELLVGEIAAAVATAEKSVALADRAAMRSDDVAARTRPTHSTPPANGKRPSDLFADAERRQRNGGPNTVAVFDARVPVLRPPASHGRAAAARDRARADLEIARRNNWILDIALETLTLGRANLASHLPSSPSELRPSRRAMRAPRPPSSMRRSRACAPPAK